MLKCQRDYPIINGIPDLVIEENISKKDLVFSQQADNYSKNYERTIKLQGLLLFAWEPRQRRHWIRNLGIARNSSILDICTGPGINLPLLKPYISETDHLVAIDLSRNMVEKCLRNVTKKKISASIHRGNALQLPYADHIFDAAISSGGINTFGDRKKGLDEMIRVVKPGGLVVISDEGMKPGKEKTWIGRRMLAMNSLFNTPPPLELIPKDRTPEVTYINRGLFYSIKFRT